MKASVVIPAYNAENTIGQCLDALAGQTWPAEEFEVIVVDDGSTDSTAALIRNYKVAYHFQPNQGPATARNKGVELAQGEIILFTDADCVPTPEWISQMIAPFADPEVAAVKGAYRTKQPQLVARFAQLEFEERFDLLEKAGSTDMIDTYSAGFRRHIFRELGGFDVSFPVANNEDTELSYRLVAGGRKLAFNPRAIVFHLDHPASIQRYTRLKFSRGYWRMVVYKKFPDKMVKDTYTPKSLKLQILFLFLFGVSLVFPLLLPGVGWLLPGAALLILLGLMTPFTVTALGKDFPVGLASPFLLTLRAGALGSGALWGALFQSKK